MADEFQIPKNYKFGEYGDKGVLKSRPTTCIVTGRSLVPGDAFVRIVGTNLFYGVKASVYRNMTDETVKTIEDQAKSSNFKSSIVPAGKETVNNAN